jgi:hypothetical protein
MRRNKAPRKRNVIALPHFLTDRWRWFQFAPEVTVIELPSDEGRQRLDTPHLTHRPPRPSSCI